MHVRPRFGRFIDKPSNKPWIYLSSRVTWFRVPINCYEVATPTRYIPASPSSPAPSLRTERGVLGRGTYTKKIIHVSYCLVTGNLLPFSFFLLNLIRWRRRTRCVKNTGHIVVGKCKWTLTVIRSPTNQVPPRKPIKRREDRGSTRRSVFLPLIAFAALDFIMPIL